MDDRPSHTERMAAIVARRQIIEALALPGIEEDALLGLSWIAETNTSCAASAKSIGALLGYGRQSGDASALSEALRNLERRGLLASKPAGTLFVYSLTLP